MKNALFEHNTDRKNKNHNYELHLIRTRSMPPTCYQSTKERVQDTTPN